MTLSCVLYLRTSLNLLEPSTTEIWMQVIQGYHGLYYYASEFWVQHLQFYLSLHGILDHPLCSALINLLSFQKRPLTETFEAKLHDHEFSNPIIASLSGMKFVPEIRTLATELLAFRAMVSLSKNRKRIWKVSCLKLIDPS
jgi:hypothetical protein